VTGDQHSVYTTRHEVHPEALLSRICKCARHQRQGGDPPILAAPENQLWLTGGHVTKRRKQGNYSQVGALDLLLKLKREDFAFWCYKWHHPRRAEGNGVKDLVETYCIWMTSVKVPLKVKHQSWRLPALLKYGRKERSDKMR